VAIKLANLYGGGLLFLDHRPVLGEKPPIGGKMKKPPIGGEDRHANPVPKTRAVKLSPRYFFLFFFLAFADM
jgi:hypothetical protein